jgi:hypothetical protein
VVGPIKIVKKENYGHHMCHFWSIHPITNYYEKELMIEHSLFINGTLFHHHLWIISNYIYLHKQFVLKIDQKPISHNHFLAHVKKILEILFPTRLKCFADVDLFKNSMA